MNKKITSSVLAALMIAGTTSFSAFAAMADGTVVIGTKAFDLAYANDPKNAEEITNAIVAGGAVYVKDFAGNWIDNTSGLAVNASVIPAVAYKNAAGVVTEFAAADKDATATVTSVTADKTTALTVSGSNLAGLKAADVTVADNTVKSVTVNEAGTTATVELEDSLIADEAVAVTVLTKSYTVTFSLNASTVAITTAIYDNDTAKQYIKVTVNDKATTAADLEAAGYDVEFSAVTKKTGGIGADIFEDDTTGKLSDNLDDYITKVGEDVPSPTATSRDAYVQVTLTKGSDIMVSALQKITIKNQDVVASSIVSAKLVNTDATYDLDNINFEQNSTKLVTGEFAAIKEIKVAVDGNDETIDNGSFTVKSSKASVVYSDSEGNLEAVAPGTATLTITYGSVTKTVSITVVKDARELTKVSIEKANTDTKISSVTVPEIVGTKEVEVIALDQYGDPMNDVNTLVFPKSSDEEVVTADIDADGIMTLTLLDTGSVTISFYTESELSYKISGSTFTVKVVENGDVSKSVLDLYEPTDTEDGDDSYSDDATIDISDDNYVAYNLNQYTSAGVLKGAAEISDLTWAESRADVVDTVTVESMNGNDVIVVKAGTKTGTVTIKAKDSETGLFYTKKITVVDQGNAIKSVAFKTIADPTYSKKYTYTSAITKTDSGDSDPKISGITMEKSVSQSVRLVADDTSADYGTLYIDKDADGAFDDTIDTAIGTLTITAVGDFEDTASIDATDNSVDLLDGITVNSGDDGTIIFKVLDTDGDIVDATSFDVNF